MAFVGWMSAALFKSLARNTVSLCLMVLVLLLESNNIAFFMAITENFHEFKPPLLLFANNATVLQFSSNMLYFLWVLTNL